MMQRRLVCQ